VVFLGCGQCAADGVRELPGGGDFDFFQQFDMVALGNSCDKLSQKLDFRHRLCQKTGSSGIGQFWSSLFQKFRIPMLANS